jgi:L-2,4-diaminobutyrate transaminase
MLRDICDRHDILLIADEVITGFGRTGKWFGVQNWDVEPDIMTVAKGISSAYMPMAAAIVRRDVADYLAGGDDHLRHILTFSGHPVSSAAALKNIEIIENENMVENAAEVGGYIKEQLEGLMMDHPIIGDVRGIGMLNAVEFVADRDTKQLFPPEARLGDRLLEKFKKHGLILRPRKDVITVGPPLCMTRDEADEMMHAIDLALWEMEGELGISRMV